MRAALVAVLLAPLALLVSGCAGLWDVHGPKTVTVGAEGGAVTVNHGAKLRIALANDPAGGFEWRRVEPPIMRVVVEGPPDAKGFNFTPVRSGEESLRFEYRPTKGEGTAQRVVSYDVTVPEDSGTVSRIWSQLFRRRGS